MRTLPFFECEQGNITEEECFALLGAQFSIPPLDVAKSIAVRSSVAVDANLLNIVRHLKATSDVRVYGAINMSAAAWSFLQNNVDEADWGLFDSILISAEVGERMPDLAFYRHLLRHIGIDPVQNITSAISVRMTGLIYNSAAFEDLLRSVRPLTRDSIGDGDEYLFAHAGQMWSTTDTGVELHENVTHNVQLANLPNPTRLLRFFRGQYFTSAGELSLINVTGSLYSDGAKTRTMDEITALRNKDGIVLTYFDQNRPRIDPVVCVNVLTFFHANGRGDDLSETLEWVVSVLSTRAYAPAGTLYYHVPDPFLYFFSRLLSASPALREDLTDLFRERVRQQFGAPGETLALSMRILAAVSVGLCDSGDYERLLTMQEEDGSWPTGWVYKYGASGVLVGNKGLTAAMAVEYKLLYAGTEVGRWGGGVENEDKY
ncbi:hypothetical protein GY45DRAFT_1347305 [Cubamyces sp. BRFM 1775]|nr:hypothetical protein GY45DRAFT_1347305 [Cubamyces sp. BRFM 1775]